MKTLHPVSYTHLDVYKRQSLASEIIFYSEDNSLQVQLVGDSDDDDVEAVSYTHLDVYKRQEDNFITSVH